MAFLPVGTLVNQFLQGNVPSSWTLPPIILPGEVGFALTGVDPQTATFQAIPAPNALKLYHYMFGANQINTGTTQRLFPWHTAAAATTAQVVGSIVQFTGTLHTLFVSHGTPTAAENITYIVQINGVDTALQVVLSSGASFASNVVNTVAVIAGDKITIRKAGLTANRLVTCRAQLLLEAA